MKCDDCDEPASVHTAIVVGGVKQELNLCKACATKRNLITPESKANLPAIVQNFVGSNVGFLTGELARLTCPDCGVGYMEFRKIGRLGCPYDYVVFRAGLLPLLDRVHRATHHTGKRPRMLALPIEARDELRRLRRELKAAIESENYEEAARVRDLMRQKEAGHGNQ